MLPPQLLPLFTHNPDEPQCSRQKNQQHDPLHFGQLPFPQPDAADFKPPTLPLLYRERQLASKHLGSAHLGSSFLGNLR